MNWSLRFTKDDPAHPRRFPVEVHETLEVAETSPAVESSLGGGTPEEPPPPRDAMTALTEQFVVATNEHPGMLDWDAAEVLLDRADGIPAVAGRRIKDAATSAASE